MIEKYFSYFHDGSIIDIKQKNESDLSIFMESAQIIPDEMKDDIELSNFSTIKGDLHFSGIISITENGKPLTSLTMGHDSGSILNLSQSQDMVILDIIWKNYITQPIERTDAFSYHIRSKTISWNNIPDYPDRFNPSIERYTDLFCGGQIFDIQCDRTKNRISIAMESGEVTGDEALMDFSLSRRRTLKGRLVLEWITTVMIDNQVLGDYSNLFSEPNIIVKFSILPHKIILITKNNLDVTEAFRELTIDCGSIDWRNDITA